MARGSYDKENVSLKKNIDDLLLKTSILLVNHIDTEYNHVAHVFWAQIKNLWVTVYVDTHTRDVVRF